MNRTAIKRKTPLARSSRIGQARITRDRIPSKYRQRVRDTTYMQFVKTLLCSVKMYSMPWRIDHDTACGGPIEADHMGRRPIGRKADDDTCAPLCQHHHRERTDYSGVFKHATRAELRLWMDEVISRTRELYEQRVAVDSTGRS